MKVSPVLTWAAAVVVVVVLVVVVVVVLWGARSVCFHEFLGSSAVTVVCLCAPVHAAGVFFFSSLLRPLRETVAVCGASLSREL